MLEVFDRDEKKLAILENATELLETISLNAISTLEFSLPYNDKKNEHCKAFNYVRLNGGDLYRITPVELDKTETGFYRYTCEHVIATLIDDVLFGYHIVGNIGVYTEKSIKYILDRQMVKRWELGTCEFSRQFEYGWENETLLSALFSIATPLADEYKWEFDTSKKPWKINLRKLSLDKIPAAYIRNRKNELQLIKRSDPREICTRLYPLGYGEGVNQLNIKGVNNGKPYIQSPQSIIDKYGIINRVWTDRRYEDVNSLKGAAETMLKKLQDPRYEYEVQFANIGVEDFDKLVPGDIVQIIDTDTNTKYKNYIIEISKNYNEYTESYITIANTPQDIAGTVADMMDRQRIEMSYAQGATQVYAQSLQANADSKSGAIINFYIPAEMRIINKVNLKVKLESFRAYSKTTVFEGRGTRTSDYKESERRTSSYEEGERIGTTTDYEGGESKTTHGEEDYNGGNVYRTVTTGRGSGDFVGYAEDYHVSHHEHRYEFPKHDHDFSYTLDGHDHTFKIPGHEHEVDITHEHKITPGIYRFGNPRSFSLYVNGRRIRNYYSTDEEIDITSDMLDRYGKIPRGNWQSVEIRPDDLSYISIDLNFQGFVQSRGDNTV